MELIEIRNNLIKLSYKEDERPTLGQFIALTGEDKSYVAQYVNLKADNINNFAVAKLMFSFTPDGVVSDYDGSSPGIKSNIVQLPANELLSLLPVETPLKIGQLTGSPDEVNVDISIFEHNFTAFCDYDSEKATFISNCVRQLFRLKEKSVIIDTDGMFEEYPKLILGVDYKLPLNSDLIDFIFDYELQKVDIPTKAVIQDIFQAVQQYIKTLDDNFLPIENFIDVVTAQYKETQMPELALLKNKLLKYKEAGIFANETSEFKILEEKLKNNNCVVINVEEIVGELQKEIITYVHKIVENFDKYVYYFVSLSDDNSDKKLLKRLLNHSHVFSIIFANHLYKYASELKSHAQNLMFFVPQTTQHDFAAYNTFINKLNQSEGVIYGKLTQGIPLIVSMEDLDLDLTKEDVFGDRERFVPAIEEDILSSESIYAINNMQESPVSQHSKPNQSNVGSSDDTKDINDIENESENVSVLYNEETVENEETDNIEEEENEEYDADSEYSNQNSYIPEDNQINQNIIEPVENIMTDEDDETSYIEQDENEVSNENSAEYEDELSFMNDFDKDTDTENSEELTEDDLDFIESENQIQAESDEDNVPVVPVYNPEEGEEIIDAENIGFKAGDRVRHPRYGIGVIEKIIKYGNKILCPIDFENVGRRLLDPSVSDFEKI